jgi:hypothetical protein
MQRLFILHLTAALLAVGCANDGTLGVRDDALRVDRTVEAGQTFTIEVGEVVLVAGTHVIVFFEGVLEDSRCPTGIECPWEGNAAARFEISLDNAELAPQPIVLNTTLEPRQTDKFGVTIRLEGLDPYPADLEPIDPASYVAELAVSPTE